MMPRYAILLQMDADNDAAIDAAVRVMRDAYAEQGNEMPRHSDSVRVPDDGQMVGFESAAQWARGSEIGSEFEAGGNPHVQRGTDGRWHAWCPRCGWHSLSHPKATEAICREWASLHVCGVKGLEFDPMTTEFGPGNAHTKGYGNKRIIKGPDYGGVV